MAGFWGLGLRWVLELQGFYTASSLWCLPWFLELCRARGLAEGNVEVGGLGLGPGRFT